MIAVEKKLLLILLLLLGMVGTLDYQDAVDARGVFVGERR